MRLLHVFSGFPPHEVARMSGAITLPARLDLPAAVKLVNDLRALDGPITVDASGVSHMGALGLQALVSASRSARKRGDTFEITGSSDKVLDQLGTMGTTPEKLSEGTI